MQEKAGKQMWFRILVLAIGGFTLGWVGGICQFLALSVLFWSSHMMNKTRQKEPKRKEESCPANMLVSQ